MKYSLANATATTLQKGVVVRYGHEMKAYFRSIGKRYIYGFKQDGIWHEALVPVSFDPRMCAGESLGEVFAFGIAPYTKCKIIDLPNPPKGKVAGYEILKNDYICQVHHNKLVVVFNIKTLDWIRWNGNSTVSNVDNQELRDMLRFTFDVVGM